MKKIKESAIVKFVIALFLIGLITGLIFYFLYKPDVANYIDTFRDFIKTGHQNTYLLDGIIISSVFILSISCIGIPLLLILLFYEGMSIGFTLGVFLSIDFFKGIVFYSLFLVVSKLVFLACLLYLSIISLSYSMKFIDAMISKNKEDLHRSIVLELYRFLIVFLVVILNSTFLYLFGNKLVGLFIGLIG